MATNQAIIEGLEDVVIGTSTICDVDGKQGRLIYAGYDIQDLVQNSTFEEVSFLLWHRRLPTAAELTDLKKDLANARTLPDNVLTVIKGLPKSGTSMEALRTVVSLLGMSDPDHLDNSQESNLRKAIRLTGQMPTAVAAHWRAVNGQEIIAPDLNPDFSLAANFLYMLNGERPNDVVVKGFDADLVLHADHEVNASTFAARVTVSTLADLHSAVVSGIGTLIGASHGGAAEAAMKTLLEIGEPSNVEPYVNEALGRGVRFMGFGHRVYKTYDPRATELRKMSEAVGKRMNNSKWYDMSLTMEKMVQDKKGLYANVDFFSASTYYASGIPVDLYTSIFAISRISGWTAHIMEQFAKNRLIRPRAEYVGARDLKYIPVENR